VRANIFLLAALGAPHVGAEDDPGLLVQEIAQGRQHGLDPQIIRNLPAHSWAH